LLVDSGDDDISNPHYLITIRKVGYRLRD